MADIWHALAALPAVRGLWLALYEGDHNLRARLGLRYAWQESGVCADQADFNRRMAQDGLWGKPGRGGSTGDRICRLDIGRFSEGIVESWHAIWKRVRRNYGNLRGQPLQQGMRTGLAAECHQGARARDKAHREARKRVRG